MVVDGHPGGGMHGMPVGSRISRAGRHLRRVFCRDPGQRRFTVSGGGPAGHRCGESPAAMNSSRTLRPNVRSGIFLGIGLEGFVDGILFHQLLQIHNMVSHRFPKTSVVNMEINMFWDGIFHVFTFAMTLAGIVMLFQAHKVPLVHWSARAFVGANLFGWGLFNLVEGTLNHHILHIHHVVETHGESLFDAAFLASGGVFMILGWLLIHTAKNSKSQSLTTPA